MTQRSSCGMLLAAFCLIILSTSACSSQSENKLLSVEEFDQKLKSKEDAVVIDLRTDDEVAQGVIENASQIDFYAKDFNSNISKLDRSKTYLVYCAAGGRSGKTAKLMTDLGFENVYDLKGGIGAWKEANKKLVPLEK